jgi:hypothetical protein
MFGGESACRLRRPTIEAGLEVFMALCDWLQLAMLGSIISDCK